MMLRFFFLFFFLLGLATSASAQKARAEAGLGGTNGRIRNGLIFGGVGAQVDGDKMSGFHKAGISGGAVSVIQLSNHWNLRFSVLYTQKGARSQSADSLIFPVQITPLPGSIAPQYLQQVPGYWLRYRLNYVQIPLLAEWRVRPRLSLQGGLSADYLLRATVDYGYGYTEPLGVTFRKVDLMGHFGVEYAFARRWGVAMQLSYSLRDISNEKVGTDRYFFLATGRLGGYRNNVLSTTLRFYLSDAPTYKGPAIFRTPADRDNDGRPPAEADETDGEPTTPR